ncbi:MAG: hypothetical protein ACUVSH_06855, partial [Anaerolineae bacterium]
MTRIEPERIHSLNTQPFGSGRHVLYWMQASQRAFWNPALEFAVDLADERGLPLAAFPPCSPGSSAPSRSRPLVFGPRFRNS